MRLFERSYRLVIETIEVSDLWIRFKVEKTMTTAANKAEIKVSNLTPDNIRHIQALDEVPVQLDAGYVEGRSTIFLGQMRSAFTTREGPDVITTLKAGDKEASTRKGRINKTIPKGTALDVTAIDLIKAMGVTQYDPAALKRTFGSVSFARSSVLHGNAARELTAICRSQGLTWSIQNGVLEVVPVGGTIKSNQAIELRPDTGLVGSPSIDNKGALTAKALIQPGLEPGRIVVVKAEFVSGQFRLESVSYSGDSEGNDWYGDCKGQAY